MMPWQDLLRAAVGLGLRPADFWALSLREWCWLSRSISAPTLTRAEFQRLLAEHPDETKTAKGDHSHGRV